ncbi:MAG: hypothetical protein ACI8X5_004002, partial [Planctomycetota bacterium]
VLRSEDLEVFPDLPTHVVLLRDIGHAHFLLTWQANVEGRLARALDTLQTHIDVLLLASPIARRIDDRHGIHLARLNELVEHSKGGAYWNADANDGVEARSGARLQNFM